MRRTVVGAAKRSGMLDGDQGKAHLWVCVVAIALQPRFGARVDACRCISRLGKWIVPQFGLVDFWDDMWFVVVLVCAVLRFGVIELFLKRFEIKCGLLLGGFLLLFDIGEVKVL